MQATAEYLDNAVTKDPAEGSRGVARFLRLFGMDLTDTTIPSAADWLVQRARSGANATIGFVNAHCINVSYSDPEYRDSLTSCDRIFIDGAGMGIAARAFGHTLQDNVNGTDLFPVLCEAAARGNVSLYMFGGREGIAGAAAERMTQCVPGLSVAGTASAYFETKEDEQAAIDQINNSGADIVLVGMGVPLQETWIARNRERLSATVVIGVGGLFDYYSGRIPRAPKLIRAAGMEWAWRLAMEPRRLARRYLLGNLEFLLRLAILKVGLPVREPRTELA